MKQYVDVGLSNDSKQEMIDSLNHDGFALVSGTFPYGQWLYSEQEDKRLEPAQRGNSLVTWFGQGTEINEVGEKFIEMHDNDESSW